METEQTDKKDVKIEFKFSNPRIQAMSEEDRIALEEELHQQIEGKPKEEQEAILNRICNPKCSKCYGRGYTGWAVSRVPLTEEEQKLSEDERSKLVVQTEVDEEKTIEYKDVRVPQACTYPRCAERTYLELHKSRYLRKYNEEKAKKASEKTQKESEESIESVETTSSES